MNVLIIPDKFKGTLTSAAAAEAMGRGWARMRPQDTLVSLPMSDGGDGFGEVMGQLLDAERRSAATVDAARRPRAAAWWWHAPSHTAIVESAQVIGLALLPRGQFHPFALDTFGLGAVVRTAAVTGARRCLVGIGGSATNDGGFGLARALGWRFLDAGGQEIVAWTDLPRARSLVPPSQPIAFEELIVAVDVQNPLQGPQGCTRVYGPQKGLRPEDFPLAEDCLERLAELVNRSQGRDVASEPGAGAAGGLGFGLRSFAGARLEPGFARYAQTANLRERFKQVQLVITGEGAIDESSLMGKGVGEVARLCRELGVPCIGLGGLVAEAARAGECFAVLRGLAPELTTADDAQRRAGYWLEELAAQTAREWFSSGTPLQAPR